MNSFFKHFRGDLFGGLTAGIVALPLALAFGVQSGMGAEAGLYGAIFIGFLASLFGGTPSQISGPTAPMTAVSMVIVGNLLVENDGYLDRALPIVLMVFFLAGLIQILLGLLGLGRYIRYIPYPVVSGFMTAIGVIILITQILPVTGYYVSEDKEYVQEFKYLAEEVILENILIDEVGEEILVLENFQETIERANQISENEIWEESVNLAKSEAGGVVGAFRVMPRAVKNVDWTEFLLAIGTILVIYGFKRITTKIPSTLVALLVVTGAAMLFGINYRPIQEIPGGFPGLQLGMFTDFNLSTISPYLFTAITLAFLGAIDSLLTSVVADNLTRTQHKPNKELMGQGIGNSIAALFGGIPGAGATIRTVVNIQSGGKTKLSGMIAALFLLVILLALGPIASQIPAAVLAGILVTVGIGVMDYKGLKNLPRMSKADALILLTVLVLSVVWNLVYAVGVGLVMASLIFMKSMGDSSEELMEGGDLNEWSRDQKSDKEIFTAEQRSRIFVKALNGPLFFGSAASFRERIKQAESYDYLIIHMEKVAYLDQTGTLTLFDALEGLKKRKVQIYLSGVNKALVREFDKVGILNNIIEPHQIQNDFNACLHAIKKEITAG